MKVVTPEIAWHETLPIYSCDLQPLASAGSGSATARLAPNREPLTEIPLAELEARDAKSSSATKSGKASSTSSEQQQQQPVAADPASSSSWTRLATAGGDNMVRLWRVHLDWTPPSAVRVARPTGRLSRGMLQSDSVAAAAAATGAAAAKKSTTTASSTGPTVCTTAAVSDGLVFLSTLRRHERLVNVVRWSPSGTYLASAGDDQFVVIWSMQSSSSERTESRPPLAGVDDADDTSSVEIWLPCRSLRRHLEDIYDLCWSPDEAFLLSGSVDHSAILWQLDLAPTSGSQEGVADQTGAKESGSTPTALRTVILRDHKHYVQGVAWDPLGDFVATMSSDRTCRIYRAGSKNCHANICKAGKQNLFQDDSWKSFFRRPAFSPDGVLLVCPAGNLESAVFAGDVSSTIAAATASNSSVTIASKVDEVNKTPLPASPIAPQHCAHIFLRGAYARPCISLPTGPRPVVAVRFCPQAFQLRLPTSAAIDLPYRLLFCLVLEDGLLFYDTQQVLPFAQVSQIHYQALNDAAWSSDARFVVTSSTDGYCSFIYFQVEEELGKPYYGPLGAAASTTAAASASATPLAKTVSSAATQSAAEFNLLPATAVSVSVAPEPMDISVESQPRDSSKPNEPAKPTITAAPLPTDEPSEKCPPRRHISFENCINADAPHASLPVTPNTGRFLHTTPGGAARPAGVKTVHPPAAAAGNKRRVPFITLGGADVVAPSKSSLEKTEDRPATAEKTE